MPSVQISFEPPCPEHRLALHGILDGYPVPGIPKTRRHLTQCARCRDFLELFKLQQRATHKSKLLQKCGPHESQAAAKSLKQFEKWLDKELSWHSEQELAEKVCLLGRRLLFSDPVRREKVFETEVTARPPKHYSEMLIRETRQRERQSSSSTAHGVSLDDIVAMLDLVTLDLSSFKQLVRISEALQGGTVGHVAYFAALIESHLGSTEAATPLFETSARSSRNRSIQAASLCHLAVIKSDSLDLEEALRLNALSIQTTPRRIHQIGPRLNRITALQGAGANKAAEREAASLRALATRDEIRKMFPYPRMIQVARFVARIFETKHAAQARLAGILGSIYGIPMNRDPMNFEVRQ